ncbi:MAG: aldo/keto reductase, partial [Candidatus Thermoplasmatota archaeon]
RLPGLGAPRGGALAGPGRTLAQSALKFVLAFPEVSVTIPGAKTPAQVEENLAAADARDLTPEEVARCRELHARDFAA